MPLAHDLQPDKSVPTNPVDAQALIEQVRTMIKSVKEPPKKSVYNKPAHWSYKSNAPYYRPVFGEVMKRVFDLILETGQPQVYYYKDHKTISASTLYLRVVQGRNYLLDHLDDDKGTYRTLNQCVSITRERGVGIVIALRHDLLELQKASGNLDGLMPKPLITSASEWKDRLDEWLNGPKSHPFQVEGLILKPSDIEDLYLQLNDIPDITFKVDERSIKVVYIK